MKITRTHLWPILIVIAIFLASSQSRLAAPDINFPFAKDKVAHFLVFGLLATSILRIPKLKQRNWRGALIAALLVSIYGGLDEFRQSMTPGRSVEIADWVADTAGAIVASVLYIKWTWYRNLLEWKAIRPKKRN